MATPPRIHPAYIQMQQDGEDLLVIQYRSSYFDTLVAYKPGEPTATMFWVRRDSLKALDGYADRTITSKKRLPGFWRKVVDRANKVVKQWFSRAGDSLQHGTKDVIDVRDLIGASGDFMDSVELPLGLVQLNFQGYTKAVLKTHSRKGLMKILTLAHKVCVEQWGWPNDVLPFTYNIHEGASEKKTVMGMAYAPGSGPQRGVRDLSLHRTLLQNYDDSSILRVVLHELAHHYREETWPRSTQMVMADAHDHLFCAALGQVDPMVQDNKQACQSFTDEEWEGGARAQREKKQTKTKKALEYGDGFFALRALKNGRLKIDWTPDRGRKQALDLHPDDLRDFLQQFDVKVRGRLPVSATDRLRLRSRYWPDADRQFVTLRQLLEQLDAQQKQLTFMEALA